MRFERDLFISYAHIDNLPLAAEQQGWVSRFHKALEALLSMRMGKEAKIWRDSKLAGSDIFDKEIVAQFEKTAILLSVLSPRYLDSDWCKREVVEFCKAAEHAAGLTIQNKSRVVKIIKSPVDSDDVLPDVMKAMLGHQFYDLDEDSTPLELDPAFGAESAQRYNVRVAKLAWEIACTLKLLDKAEVEVHLAVAAEALPAKPTVYLAECSFDQRDAREALDAELRCHGYRVLPDHPLPRDEAAFVEEVEKLLKQSQLSVHLIGKSYGAVPDGESQKSIVVLQNELATQASHNAGLRRIIWLPEGTVAKQPDQEQFIRDVQTDPEAQFGADVITSNQKEAIKGAIHEALQKIEGQPAKAAARPARHERKLVYLICDARDRKNTLDLRRLLLAKGFDVEIPLFEGDSATVRQANQDMLAQ